mmetsp:Transcript_55004/g.125179  ORF Transcript_55004/g.125179 Transcript_55004/m.125179 type:complete len:362 (-) Transcript_55004:5-1090(-)
MKYRYVPGLAALLFCWVKFSEGAPLQQDGHGCQPLRVKDDAQLEPAATMVDEETELLIMSSAKAGATLAERLMFAHLNLTEKAMEVHGHIDYPLSYKNIFDKQPGHGSPYRGSPRGMDEYVNRCSPTSSWLCLAIVRNPLDRAISSYIHSMSHLSTISKTFRELGDNEDATYVKFAEALHGRARNGGTSKGAENHFMPQIVPKTKEGRLRPGVLYVPIEMLSEPDGYQCPLLERVQGWRVAELENAVLSALGAEKGTPATGRHYVVQMPGSSGAGSQNLPFPEIAAAKAENRMPSYDSFWGNKSFCKHVVGCLYRRDVELYVETCATPELRGCRAFRAACEEQLGRLRRVCGLEEVAVRFF